MEILLDVIKWSIIAGALALVLTLLKPALEKRYSARWRYWAWLALAILALLAPVQWEKLLPGVPAAAPVVIGVPEMELQVVQGERTPVLLQPVSPGSVPAETGRIWRLAELLPAVWLGGAAAFALYTLAGARLFRRKARRWSRTPKEETARVYEAVQRDMGLKKAPPLLVSGAAGSPMLAGVLRPCLLLPDEKWNERELAFILRHELTHYRRHDLWYKCILLAANAIHWFNPLMYLLVKGANTDLELLCDGDVVSGASQETRRAYSETLLAAVHRNKRLGTALSTHFYGGKSVMKERFRNILGKRGQKWGVLVLALTLMAALLSACAFVLQQADAKSTPSNETDPVQDELHTNDPNDYIDQQAARLSGRGVAVTDRREKMTLADTCSWDSFDGEIQVWKLDYALKLEHPEAYTPAGSETLDGDGWLSGIDGQGEPHFIYSVNRGGAEPAVRLEEIAYSNVEWELGYTWDEYVRCHTLLGLDLSPSLNGWPEISTEFLAAMREGHNTWAAVWEDTAYSYLTLHEGVDVTAETRLTTLQTWTFDKDFNHDESRLLQVSGGGCYGYMMLTHTVYPVETWNTTLRFWQVAGWIRTDPVLEQFQDTFSNWSSYPELFDAALKTDGAYAELAANALAGAFLAQPETFVSELSQMTEEAVDSIAGMLVYGAEYPDFHDAFTAQIAAMAEKDLAPEEQAVVDAIDRWR